MEGISCLPAGSECDKEEFKLPVFDYSHENGAWSVTSGYVYRGSNLPELSGLYIYTDYVPGRIGALDASDPDNPENNELFNADFRISSFGVDSENEILQPGLTDAFAGLARIFRMSNVFLFSPQLACQ